ncbi:hypothetical protein EJB05_29922, partial [Eragrostis curvula]
SLLYRQLSKLTFFILDASKHLRIQYNKFSTFGAGLSSRKDKWRKCRYCELRTCEENHWIFIEFWTAQRHDTIAWYLSETEFPYKDQRKYQVPEHDALYSLGRMAQERKF